MTLPVSEGRTRLSYAAKFSRLRERLRDPEWRRYGKLLLAGKMLGVLLTLALMLLITVGPSLLSGTVHAQAPATAPAVPTAAAPAAAYPTVTASDVVNPLNRGTPDASPGSAAPNRFRARRGPCRGTPFSTATATTASDPYGSRGFLAGHQPGAHDVGTL